MCRKINKYLLLNLLIICTCSTSCSSKYYYFNIKNGESVPRNAPYTLTKEMSTVDFLTIDTTKFYVGTTYSTHNKDYKLPIPQLLKFSSNGFLSIYFQKNQFEIQKAEECRFTLEDNKIKIEIFFPSKGGKTKLYTKNIIVGYVNGNTIAINWSNNLTQYYEKSNSKEKVVN